MLGKKPRQSLGNREGCGLAVVGAWSLPWVPRDGK